MKLSTRIHKYKRIHSSKRAALNMAESSHKIEPLAIIGLSFKFPQGMETAESLWERLATSRSAWSPFPESRLNFDGVYDPDSARLNSVNNLSIPAYDSIY